MAPWALPPCKTAAIRAPFGKWHTYTTFWPSCSESDERIKDYAPPLCPFGKWHTYTTFWPSGSESDERITDSALRRFRSGEAFFSLFLVRFQDSSNV